VSTRSGFKYYLTTSELTALRSEYRMEVRLPRLSVDLPQPSSDLAVRILAWNCHRFSHPIPVPFRAQGSIACDGPLYSSRLRWSRRDPCEASSDRPMVNQSYR